MRYPKTGEEVYVSLHLSNTMLSGIGKGTITREEVSVDYLKRLFAKHIRIKLRISGCTQNSSLSGFSFSKIPFWVV